MRKKKESVIVELPQSMLHSRPFMDNLAWPSNKKTEVVFYIKINIHDRLRAINRLFLFRVFGPVNYCSLIKMLRRKLKLESNYTLYLFDSYDKSVVGQQLYHGTIQLKCVGKNQFGMSMDDSMLSEAEYISSSVNE